MLTGTARARGPASQRSTRGVTRAPRSPLSAMPAESRLLKRVFDIDVERCECGGQLKILAAIEEPVVIVRILMHLGLPAQAPPRAAAREFSLDCAAWPESRTTVPRENRRTCSARDGIRASRRGG